MIKYTEAQVTSVTIDTVRLAYIELSFDSVNARAILSYGTTDKDGNFTEVRRSTVDMNEADGIGQALSDARDAFEAVLITGDSPRVAIAASQVTEAVAVAIPARKV